MRKLLFVSLFAGACTIKPSNEINLVTPMEEERESEEIVTEVPVAIDEEKSNPRIESFEITPNDQANSYSVHLKWSGVNLGQSIAIKRKELLTQQSLNLDLLNISSTEYLDQSAVGGSKYEYQISVLGSETLVESEKITIEIPQDLLLSKDMVIQSIEQKYERVFIANGIRLRTLSSDVSIVTNELVSDLATIDTSPESSVAPLNNHGLSGGNLEIKAIRARGILHIVGTAQTGGEGKSGIAGARGAKGAKGRDGLDDFELFCPFQNDRGIFSKILSTFSPCHRTRYCSVETGNGENGAKGDTGGNGESGLRGGDSTKVFIEILEPSEFELRPQLNVGRGGLGGIGGLGGPGGPGGDPGTPTTVCKAAKSGGNGPRGDRGLRGPQGPDGNQLAFCFKHGSAQFGDCAAFN